MRVVLLGFIVYSVISLGEMQLQLIRENDELNERRLKTKRLELRNQQITDLLKNGSEADFIVRAARDRLGYVFADEEVFVDISGR